MLSEFHPSLIRNASGVNATETDTTNNNNSSSWSSFLYATPGLVSAAVCLVVLWLVLKYRFPHQYHWLMRRLCCFRRNNQVHIQQSVIVPLRVINNSRNVQLLNYRVTLNPFDVPRGQGQANVPNVPEIEEDTNEALDELIDFSSDHETVQNEEGAVQFDECHREEQVNVSKKPVDNLEDNKQVLDEQVPEEHETENEEAVQFEDTEIFQPEDVTVHEPLESQLVDRQLHESSEIVQEVVPILHNMAVEEPIQFTERHREEKVNLFKIPEEFENVDDSKQKLEERVDIPSADHEAIQNKKAAVGFDDTEKFQPVKARPVLDSPVEKKEAIQREVKVEHEDVKDLEELQLQSVEFQLQKPSEILWEEAEESHQNPKINSNKDGIAEQLAAQLVEEGELHGPEDVVEAVADVHEASEEFHEYPEMYIHIAGVVQQFVERIVSQVLELSLLYVEGALRGAVEDVEEAAQEFHEGLENNYNNIAIFVQQLVEQIVTQVLQLALQYLEEELHGPAAAADVEGAAAAEQVHEYYPEIYNNVGLVVEYLVEEIAAQLLEVEFHNEEDPLHGPEDVVADVEAEEVSDGSEIVYSEEDSAERENPRKV